MVNYRLPSTVHFDKLSCDMVLNTANKYPAKCKINSSFMKFRVRHCYGRSVVCKISVWIRHIRMSSKFDV